MISKSARTCPQCGKTFTNAVGLILAVIFGIVVGWLLIARTCSRAADADNQIEDMQEMIRKAR